MTALSVAALLVFIALSGAAALMGSWFRPGEWYERLKKPSWRPPNWLFAPVWSALYLMMAVAAWLVWKDTAWPVARAPLVLWLGQLIINASWTPAFFGLKRPDLGLIVIAALWLAIATTIVSFTGVSTAAAWLMVPYLCWVSFATLLNLAVWRLNRPVAVS